LKFAAKNSIEPALFDDENVHDFCRKSGCFAANRNVFRSNGLATPRSIVLGISYRMFLHEKQDYPREHALGEATAIDRLKSIDDEISRWRTTILTI